MTREEAIKHLQNLKFKFLDEYIDYDSTAEAFQHGIKALEKQIPTKPINSFMKNRLICPSCQEYTERASKYCCHCGQALDWSEE